MKCRLCRIVGEDDPAAGDVVGLVTGDDHDRIGNSAQNLLEARAFGLDLDLNFGRTQRLQTAVQPILAPPHGEDRIGEQGHSREADIGTQGRHQRQKPHYRQTKPGAQRHRTQIRRLFVHTQITPRPG